MPTERIERIKNSLDQYEDEDAPTKKAPGLDSIIKRLQENSSQKGKGTTLTLKSEIEGTSAGPTELDFGRVAFEQKPGEADSFLKMVGSLYESFSTPINFLAEFLSKLPAAATLRNDLDAADMNMTVEAYLVLVTVTAMIVSAITLVMLPLVMLAIGQPLLAGLSPIVAGVMFVVVGFVGLMQPSSAAQAKAIKINRELPFALRHLSTQIKAGVSFHRALSSVAASDYGILSEELTKVIRELEKGSSTEEALLALVHRTRSTGLKKALIQIIRSLRTGGNLSDIIKEIANDVSYEYQMRVRDFVEKLNIVNVVFTMIAVVGPVVITVISAVAQLPALGASMPFSSVVVMFIADIMAMCVIVWFITQMESSI